MNVVTPSVSRYVSLASDVLDALLPMHLTLDVAGRILSIGPTLKKLKEMENSVGRDFFDVFELVRPRSIMGIDDLWIALGRTLHFRLRNDNRTQFRAVALPIAKGEAAVVVSMSFGIYVEDAVAAHNLTIDDFAATDLTVEMLYLMEAKSAAMEEARRLIHRTEEARNQAEERSVTDALTGLPNRRALDRHLAKATSGDAGFALLVIDLDFFKTVNDTQGHAAGDQVLMEVASRLRAETRPNDLVARIGGDEFVVFLGRVLQGGALQRIAERMIASVARPITYGAQDCRVGASIGGAIWCPNENRSAADVQDAADAALYKAKRAGRERAVLEN